MSSAYKRKIPQYVTTRSADNNADFVLLPQKLTRLQLIETCLVISSTHNETHRAIVDVSFYMSHSKVGICEVAGRSTQPEPVGGTELVNKGAKTRDQIGRERSEQKGEKKKMQATGFGSLDIHNNNTVPGEIKRSILLSYLLLGVDVKAPKASSICCTPTLCIILIRIVL